jgi:hypothetical protein
MVIGIFRFTIYRRMFTKPLRFAGLSVSADAVSVVLFAVGFLLVLMFVVQEIQPLYYKGRDMRYEPGRY